MQTCKRCRDVRGQPGWAEAEVQGHQKVQLDDPSVAGVAVAQGRHHGGALPLEFQRPDDDCRKDVNLLLYLAISRHETQGEPFQKGTVGKRTCSGQDVLPKTVFLTSKFSGIQGVI